MKTDFPSFVGLLWGNTAWIIHPTVAVQHARLYTIQHTPLFPTEEASERERKKTQVSVIVHAEIFKSSRVARRQESTVGWERVDRNQTITVGSVNFGWFELWLSYLGYSSSDCNCGCRLLRHNRPSLEIVWSSRRNEKQSSMICCGNAVSKFYGYMSTLQDELAVRHYKKIIVKVDYIESTCTTGMDPIYILPLEN
jgi:hypothetical protein